MADWYWRDGSLAYRYGEPGWLEKAQEVEQKWSDMEYRRVARTELGDGRYVSTVWLGLDHGHYGGVPLIFESMLFPSCEDCDRYATKSEALAGHEEMAAKWATKC